MNFVAIFRAKFGATGGVGSRNPNLEKTLVMDVPLSKRSFVEGKLGHDLLLTFLRGF